MRTTELTVQVFDDLPTIFSKLSKQNFDFVEKYTINDWYFSAQSTTPQEEYEALMKSSFLVRQILSDKEKLYLCHKDKQFDKQGRVVSEKQTKVVISNLEDTLQIFKSTNLNNWCNLQQTMYDFKKDGFKIIVQDVQGLGIFIEYEQPASIHKLPTQKQFDVMKSNLTSLGLTLGTDFFCKKVFMKFLSQTKNKKSQFL